MSFRHPQEIETTLLIRTRDACQVLKQVKDLRIVAGYPLTARPPQELRDTYFDTADRRLTALRCGLRARRVMSEQGLWLLTFKAASRRDPRGSAVREELERPWTLCAMARLADRLSGMGIDLPQDSASRFGPDPVETLRSLGFEIVQRRTTRRHIRQVHLEREAGSTPIAEIDLDEVVFQFADLSVRHFEVEIEAKSTEGRHAINQVAAALRAELGPGLEPWPHSKLALGFFLASWYEAGRLPEQMENVGRLKTGVYDEIRRGLTGGA